VTSATVRNGFPCGSKEDVPMTRRGDKTGPMSVGDLLRGSARLAPRGGRIASPDWRRIVGERVADRTRPGNLHDGVLTVYVASAVWAQELTFLSPAILDRLQKTGSKARELRFRIGEIAEPVSATELAPAAPEAKMAALPAELSKRLACVEDPKLRALIAEAAAYSLGREPPPYFSAPKASSPSSRRKRNRSAGPNSASISRSTERYWR